jgi:hypothetical protein
VVSLDQKLKNVTAFETVVKVASLGGAPVAPLTDWYSLAPIQPSGGRWYFGFECPTCNRFSPMFLDFSDGNMGNPFRNHGVHATCYFCQSNVRCASEGIRTRQWPLEPGQTPPRSEYAHRVPRKYVEDPEYQPLRGPLHHYTSIDALLSIVKTKVLWATNIRYLNDSSESELGLTLMREVITQELKTATGIDLEVLTFLAEWLDARRIENASVYVLSFSTAHNQLSQWRGYTRYGHGVCLSIDSGLLVRRMQDQGWTFQNCRYSRTSQLTWAEAILAGVRREAAVSNSRVDQSKEHSFEAALRRRMSDLLQVAATIKHEAFAQEHEVRFISPMIDITDNRIAYRSGHATRIPYVEFQLAVQPEDLVLHEVMIGPGAAQERSRLSIAAALKEAGVGSYAVTVSGIPYREL